MERPSYNCSEPEEHNAHTDELYGRKQCVYLCMYIQQIQAPLQQTGCLKPTLFMLCKLFQHSCWWLITTVVLVLAVIVNKHTTHVMAIQFKEVCGLQSSAGYLSEARSMVVVVSVTMDMHI